MSFFQSKNSFEGQYPDEKVIMLLRRHWFILFLIFAAYFLFALLPFVVFYFFGEQITTRGFGELYLFAAMVYFIFWWLGLFYKIMIYLLDVWIITDHRIIDSEQKGFFDRVVAEAKISRIQDVATRVSDPMATFLNFGNVEIQTAGTTEKFVFKQVPNPNLIRETLLRACSDFSRLHPDGAEPPYG